MLHRAARNAYSWWWASHIRTKQSKWMEQNLSDMEEKVEYILKIIEEDGDSFAKRAEMYYRKRPELLNFVEDSFRGYRALAERYDHLSRELQSANRTIATVYPEQVQLAMDDEYLEDFPTTSVPDEDPKKHSKNLPAVPSLNIPKTPIIPQKKSKSMKKLMSKKGLLKMSVLVAAAPTTSGMSKDEALEEIDRLQKKILGCQTEKEFVKSLYESGVAKYWAIEEQVIEMQARVNSLQDEFGVGTFIEDDEARTLMAATALKSCQETLIRLQEKHKLSDEEAREEYQRIKEVHVKLEILKGSSGTNTNNKDLHENLQLVNTSEEPERHDFELLREKIKEQLQVSATESLTMSELAEKIDDLVDKVITLETAVSSQNALVKRLRSETNELQVHLWSLEEDKEALIGGSDSKSDKIRELEQELLRILSLNKNVKNQNKDLQIHFTEASFSIDHLSEKLQTVKQDEEAVPDITPKKEFQVREVLALLASRVNISKMSKDVKTEGIEKVGVPRGDSVISKEKEQKHGIADHEISARTEDDNFVQSNSGQVDDLLVPVEVRNFANANLDRRFEDNVDMMGLGNGPASNRTGRVVWAANKDGVPDQALSVPGNTMVEGLNEGKQMMAENAKMEEIESKNDLPDHHQIKAERQYSFQFDSCHISGDSSVNGKVRAGLDTNFEALHREVLMATTNDKKSTGLETEIVEKKYDNQEGRASVKVEEENIVQSCLSNPNDDLPRTGQERAAQDVPETVFKEPEGVLDPRSDSLISDLVLEQKRHGVSLVYDPVREEEILVQSNPSKLLGNRLGEVLVQAVPGANCGKAIEEHEDMVAPGDDSPISKDGIPKKEEPKDDFLRNKATEEANILSNRSNHIDFNCGKDSEANGDHNVESQEPETEDEDQPRWKKMFLNGLDDRERILLHEYTSLLRNYEETKQQLSDLEKKNQDSIKELKNANAFKDAQIQSLQKKLHLLQVCMDETLETSLRDLKAATSQVLDTSSPNPGKAEEESTAPDLAIDPPGKGDEGEKRVFSVDEPPAGSVIQEKFRSDIDGLLEENIEFWLRFSTSCHQIRKFQNSVQDLQEELANLRECRKQEGGTKQQSLNSDVRPIYKHLREIQTELALWLEHNTLLEDDLQNRLSSLSDIQDEITRLSNAGSREEETELSDYQAVKFQGEVLNMKQENNKVACKLQVGLDRVKELRIQIARTLEDLEEELGISKSKDRQTKSSSSRSRIPLRSFLFGVRLRKQKPSSLFQCMSPALQKQYSDLHTLPL